VSCHLFNQFLSCDFLSFSAGGRLYSFGANNEGQLGIELDESLSPQVIDALGDMEYSMVAAGSEHSAALTGMPDKNRRSI
jgi:alpha-tubulin suppressor-like RCC1 family protein